MGRSKRQEEEVSLEALLGQAGAGFTTREVGSTLSKKKAWGRFLLGLVTIPTFMGLLFSLLPLSAMGAGVLVAEPLVKAWKAMPDQLPPVAIAQQNVFYDKNNTPFAVLWSQNRSELTSVDQISPLARQGLIDTEDKRFYQSKGFDLIGTLRSAATGSGGGSGITQQLIKNLQFYNLIGKESQANVTAHSYARKIKELKLAVAYSKTHSKDEILLAYFNTVALGGPNIYGIQTASQYFFGKDAKDLDLAQATALVGTAQNPSIYNLALPSHYQKWKDRQAEVLSRMLSEGHITRAQYDEAKGEKLTFLLKATGGSNCYSSKYPYYCKYVLDTLEASSRLGDTQAERDAVIAKGGLQVHTYMDPTAMDQANTYLKNNFGTTNRIVAPTAVVQPGTGGVVALAQNRDWGYGKGKTELLLPTQASGEGSVYKIFMLATALNSGMTESDLAFSSDCPLRPDPSRYDSPPNGFKNSVSCAFQGGFLNYKQAVAYSSNTWFVTLEEKVGVDKLKAFSKTVGLKAPDSITPRSLSYTLGSVENSPLAISAAFATFANKGVYCPPTPIASLTYSDGSEPAVPDNYDPASTACRAVMSPHSASVVLKAMQANMDGSIPRSFGHKAAIAGHDTAGKSGTNEDLNTTWEQMTPQYSVFTNVYDMTDPIRGIDGVMFKGESHPWYENTATLAGSDILRGLLAGKPNIPLDTSNSDTSITTTPVDESAFTTVPNVLGMSPTTALGILTAAGLQAEVTKTPIATPQGFTPGAVASQSVDPGTRLARGSTKTIILSLGK